VERAKTGARTRGASPPSPRERSFPSTAVATAPSSAGSRRPCATPRSLSRRPRPRGPPR
jgi:hypothetical protein